MVWKLNVQFEFMKGGSDNAFFIQKKETFIHLFSISSLSLASMLAMMHLH